MTVPGTETDVDTDSVDTTADDTQTTDVHTPEVVAAPDVDIDELLSTLESVKDKIAPERLQFLNKDLQAGYTRRLNLLNRSAETAVNNIVTETGVKIPDGKSPLDLLTENDGKDFFNLIRGQVAQEVKPLTDMAEMQKVNENIRQMVNVAVENFPEVKENAVDVIRVIDNDPELARLGQAYEGRALPYVMRGVAAVLKSQKLETEVARLNGLLKAATVGKTVGTTSSRAGGTRPTSEAPPDGKGRLDWSIAKAFEKIESEAH